MPRTPFPFPSNPPSYFLGHMARSLRLLPPLLKNIDLVIEARDARLPLSGINPTFEDLLRKTWGRSFGQSVLDPRTETQSLNGKNEQSIGGIVRSKEKIVVYTKRDLAEDKYEMPLKNAFLRHAHQRIFFANTAVDKDIKTILKYAVELARSRPASSTGFKVLVCGMPNVGKSSLLNALRRVGVKKGKAFRVSSQPGYTRKLTGTVKIHEDPDVYVYDSPGVMVPYMGKGVKGGEKGLKLALTTGIKEGLFEEELVAEYALYLLNQHYFPINENGDGPSSSPSSARPTYLDLLGISAHSPDPPEQLDDLLNRIALRLGTRRAGGELDHDAALSYFLRMFRAGQLGRVTLDDLESLPTSDVAAEDSDVPSPSDSEKSKSNANLQERVALVLEAYLDEQEASSRDDVSPSQQKKITTKKAKMDWRTDKISTT